MTCPDCGHSNENGVLFCRGCRTLFLGDSADDALPPDENERVLVLAQACELVRNGFWTLTEFRQYLNEFAEEQSKREGGIRDVDIPFGLEEEFEEERQVGFTGVDACNHAIAMLGEYDPETTGEHVLHEGLRQFHRGISQVKEAMKINRRNYGRPLWI